MALIAAALFATVLNMSQASNAIGAPTGLSLLDELHIVGLAIVVIAAVVGIIARLRVERGDDFELVRRFDHAAFAACTAFAVAANVALIAAAAA
jgi:hypothetical protein